MPRLFREWPPALRQSADLQEWRLSEVEKAVDEIRDPSIPTIKTPLGQLPWPVAVIGFGLLAWWRPDIAARFLGL